MTDPYLSAEYDRTPVPAARPTVSDKSRAVAVALGFITGVFGGHRYYAGKVRTGLLMTFTFGGMGIWWCVDMILLLAGEFRDGDGRKIREWLPSEMMQATNVAQEQIADLQREVERLSHELMDVHERMDFHERLLQRGRE